MRDFSKKRRSPVFALLRLLGSVGVVVLLALFVFVSSRATWEMYQKFAEASRSRQAAERELAALVEKEARVRGAAAALSSQRGIEEQVRARFGVARPGEGLITVVRDEASAEASSQEPQNLWKRILQLFGW